MNALDHSLKSFNPMTGAVLWEGRESLEPQVNEAVHNARDALPGWSSLPRKEREKHLRAFKEGLLARKDLFADMISQETGKPLWESSSEVEAMAAKVEISIEAQSLRCPEKVNELPKGRSVTRHKPLGVLSVFGPFNFPGHLPNGHIVPALLAGNTVVFKPSELTPLIGEEMVRIWNESGLPNGVVNLVQGGSNTGKVLSSHPGIDGLLFTGSWKTGRVLARQFSEHPEKLLALEMGGNNPLIAWDVSDTEAAALVIAQSAFITAGQRCTCARRLIIPRDRLGDEILDALLEIISRIAVGAWTDRPEPFMGPVIHLHASNSLLTTQQALLSMGGKAILEMKELQPETPLVSPAVIDVSKKSTHTDEEYFGPLLQVFRAGSFEEAVKEANNTRFGLAAGILSDKRERYESFYRQSRAGIVNWNMPTTGASSSAPFGGVGRSGNYRPSALYAADYCNYPVASMEAETLKSPEKLPPGISAKKE